MLGKRLRPKLCFCCCGALALHWLAIQRMRLLAAMLEIHFLRLLCLLGGSTKNDKTFGWNLARSFPRCYGGFTSFLRFTFWGFPPCQAGAQKLSRERNKISQGASLGATVVSLFFLRFAFWGFPRCQAGFILADLSAWTSCFFNVHNFDFHVGILITFACKAANCDSRLRILSKSATLSIRYRNVILVQWFSSVPFRT